MRPGLVRASWSQAQLLAAMVDWGPSSPDHVQPKKVDERRAAGSQLRAPLRAAARFSRLVSSHPLRRSDIAAAAPGEAEGGESVADDTTARRACEAAVALSSSTARLVASMQSLAPGNPAAEGVVDEVAGLAPATTGLADSSLGGHHSDRDNLEADCASDTVGEPSDDQSGHTGKRKRGSAGVVPDAGFQVRPLSPRDPTNGGYPLTSCAVGCSTRTDSMSSAYRPYTWHGGNT